MVAAHVPEMHVIGEILGGVGFGTGVSCMYRVEAGKNWTLLCGHDAGHTQVAYADPEELAPWNHPLDVHYTTKSMQGWPRLVMQVWRLDEFGRMAVQGYGFAHLPCAAGAAEVAVPCWRPVGSVQEEIASFFLGTAPQLRSDEVLFNMAWDQRCQLTTAPSGTIILQLNILLRDMRDQNVDT
ncbi:B9 domain-containing protein [Tribonema minus]|uniref:B9 domain-containing protein 2 n=1 Tax=Tribonema minus TaxID=303371 RepID=A0A836CKT8_9STRA|nr:B9 domain-containing protein [Tribonema minus]